MGEDKHELCRGTGVYQSDSSFFKSENQKRMWMGYWPYLVIRRKSSLISMWPEPMEKDLSVHFWTV